MDATVQRFVSAFFCGVVLAATLVILVGSFIK
jgi:hypothetical protein